MKLDYAYLKQLLNAIQAKQSHFVNVMSLAQELKDTRLNIDEDDYYDKFYGHLFLLKDNRAIEEVYGHNLGVQYTADENVNCSDSFIRLTSSGYDFMTLLNKEGIADKIKKFTLSSGIYAGKIAAEKAIEKVIDNLT